MIHKQKCYLIFIGILIVLPLLWLAVGHAKGSATSVKIAFIGDLDSNSNTSAVLRLIKNEQAEAVFFQGDLNYQDNPQWLIDEITATLGSNFPVFAATGHHEDLIDLQNKKYSPGHEWPIYKADFMRRIQNIPGADCSGEYGINSLCHFKGIAFVLSAAEIVSGSDLYIKNTLGADPALWKICSFHTSEWDDSKARAVMEECRKMGAIISVSHDHAYGRTFVLGSFVSRNPIGAATPLYIQKGQTYMTISGLGGQGRGGIENFPSNPSVFAKIATLNEKVNYGALFCDFSLGKMANDASCYFKDIAGKTWDQFDVINKEVAGTPAVARTPAPAPAQTGTMQLGTNIAPLVDWSGEWMFTDAFKTARPWVSGEKTGCSFNCPFTFPKLNLDSSGWVKSLQTNLAKGGQVARSVIFSAGTLQYLPGRYTITYEGEGKIEYEGATKNIPASQPGMDIVDVAPGNSNNFILKLVQTDPNHTGNYIRNIQVLLPGFASHRGKQVFHPDFKKNLQQMNVKVVRFMDAMATNNAWYKEYNDYPQLSDAFWTAMPAKKQAELCNSINCDVWVTMPHLASDNFVLRFARVLKNTLNSNHKVYVEYSNEVWNGGFSQMRDVALAGCNRNAPNDPVIKLDCDKEPKTGFTQQQCDSDAAKCVTNGIYCEGFPRQWDNGCGTQVRREYSERSVEIWNIFEQIFGGTRRLVRVMGSQIGSGNHTTILLWKKAWQKTDVLAVAPYVGGEIGSNSSAADWSLNRLFTELNEVSLPTALARIDKDITLLQSDRRYANIELVAYEGGQHLVGIGKNRDNDRMTSLFQSANRDPRIKQFYTLYLKGLKARGIRLFMHFNNVQKWTKFGNWGAKEYTSQPDSQAYKYQMLKEFRSGGNP